MAGESFSRSTLELDKLYIAARNFVNSYSPQTSYMSLRSHFEALEEAVVDVLNNPQPFNDIDDDILPCEVSDQGCLAPAAIRAGSGIADGTESADLLCYTCGLPVCAECSQMLTQLTIHGEYESKRTCNNCKHDRKEEFLWRN